MVIIIFKWHIYSNATGLHKNLFNHFEIITIGIKLFNSFIAAAMKANSWWKNSYSTLLAKVETTLFHETEEEENRNFKKFKNPLGFQWGGS